MFNLPAKLESGTPGKIPGERISSACEIPEVICFLGILWLIYLRLCANTVVVLDIHFFWTLRSIYLLTQIRLRTSEVPNSNLGHATSYYWRFSSSPWFLQTLRNVISHGNCFPIGADVQLTERTVQCYFRNVNLNPPVLSLLRLVSRQPTGSDGLWDVARRAASTA